MPIWRAGKVINFPLTMPDAMLESKVVWSAETLDKHLSDVPGFIPGNRMGKVFKNGVKKPDDRAAVIEFLRSSSQ